MEVSPLSVVIAAAMLSLVLFVFIYSIIPILTGKQIPWIGGQAEAVTEDCDEDGVIGLNDKCPCVNSKQSLEKDQTCGSPEERAAKNCPALCKKR